MGKKSTVLTFEDVMDLHEGTSPMTRFLWWIQEREKIRHLKTVSKLPPPWTADPILQHYKFCNVRRMDDRVSQWLLNNWYKPFHGHKNMLLAATAARMFNTPEALEEIGFPKIWNPKKVKGILEDRMKRGDLCFSGAYMITGTLGGTKIEQVVDKVLTPLHTNKPKEAVPNTHMEELWRELKTRAGFASFMAGQVTADLRWGCGVVGGNTHWQDRIEWAPMGPGSQRGMNRLHDREIKAPIKEDQWKSELIDVVNVVKKRLPDIYFEKSQKPRLEAIDIQNCLCEFDKYERTRLGEGTPKQRYNGRGE